MIFSQRPKRAAQQRNGDLLSATQSRNGGLRLGGIVANHGPNQHVGIGGDLHGSPAQPAVAAALISAMLATLGLRSARRPIKALMLPGGLAAHTSILPPGRVITSICWPG